ncbi:MAG: hypothetical protein Q4G07_06290 [Oscillospiraceae bacterium]|nr:hypothetical protein [Oscillospiraceae bacterium]
MKASAIYAKTMNFVWLKLGLGLLTLVISCVLLGLAFGIAALFQFEGGLLFFLLGLWLVLTASASGLINHYFGYLVKAGHIAVVTEAVTTGVLPDAQFSAAAEKVKARFAASNVYFVVDRLVSGAVRQLQNGVDKVDSMLGNLPGVSALLTFAKLFIGVALGYVDECCLGYTFYKQDQNAFKSAADGVVIYFQNWKTLMKSAAKTSLIVVGLFVAVTIVSFALLGGLFALLGWSGWIAFLLSFLVAYAVKSAFIDSYIMIKMLSSYMQTAPSTEITFDLYEKLCKLSRKFKELFQKGKSEASAAVPSPAPGTV